MAAGTEAGVVRKAEYLRCSRNGTTVHTVSPDNLEKKRKTSERCAWAWRGWVTMEFLQPRRASISDFIQ